MGCPRCGGSLERFALGDSQSVNCERCGWVGIDVDLGHSEREPATDSWDEAVAGVAGRPADQPDRTEHATAETAGDDAAPAQSDGAEDASAAAVDDIDALIDIDADDAEQLRTTGIRTVDDLAISDPRTLADEAGLPEHRLRTYVRRASIRLATGGAE